jgi:hypothetical protein
MQGIRLRFLGDYGNNTLNRIRSEYVDVYGYEQWKYYRCEQPSWIQLY